MLNFFLEVLSHIWLIVLVSIIFIYKAKKMAYLKNVSNYFRCLICKSYSVGTKCIYCKK